MYRPQRSKVNECPETPNDQHPHPQMQKNAPPGWLLQAVAADRPAPEYLCHYGHEVKQKENANSHTVDDAHNCLASSQKATKP
jgi:hypothetical protein